MLEVGEVIKSNTYRDWLSLIFQSHQETIVVQESSAEKYLHGSRKRNNLFMFWAFTTQRRPTSTHTRRFFAWLLPYFPLQLISFICYSQLIPGQSHHNYSVTQKSLRFHGELITPCAGLSTLGWLGSYIPSCPVISHTSKGHGTFILENTGICWTLISVRTFYTLSLARSINTVVVPSKQIIFYILPVHRRQHHTHNDINLQFKHLRC